MINLISGTNKPNIPQIIQVLQQVEDAKKTPELHGLREFLGMCLILSAIDKEPTLYQAAIVAGDAAKYINKKHGS
jgi:hypothetical protein